MRARIFDGTACKLGEGALWVAARESFVWLDILSHKLYEKSFVGVAGFLDLGLTATAILPCSDPMFPGVWLVASDGIYEVDLTSGARTILHRFSLPHGYRTNDAGVDPEGRIVFGVMEWQPSGLNGWVSRIEHNGSVVQLIDDVGIPNTIVWSASGRTMYYADSFLQKMYSVEYSEVKVADFFSLECCDATPDGSCVFEGHLYTAEWDGARVSKRCIKTGILLAELALPVLRPTSCAIACGEILVTTASDGLSLEQLSESLDSGKTFIAALSDFKSVT